MADLGGQSVGSQFAIFTYRDFDDLGCRETLIRIVIDCWCEIAEPRKGGWPPLCLLGAHVGWA
jgi:D-erythrulose 1-phosphate 3-epimerase